MIPITEQRLYNFFKVFSQNSCKLFSWQKISLKRCYLILNKIFASGKSLVVSKHSEAFWATQAFLLKSVKNIAL